MNRIILERLTPAQRQRFEEVKRLGYHVRSGRNTIPLENHHWAWCERQNIPYIIAHAWNQKWTVRIDWWTTRWHADLTTELQLWAIIRYRPALERCESRESMSGLATTLGPAYHSTAAIVHAAKHLTTHTSPFVKKIGKFAGYEQVNGVYTMPPGKFVQVAMTSSGGKTVNWKIYNADGHHLLGKISEEAGDRKTIWTNDTGRNISVVFEADPVAVVNVKVTGKFVFGYY